MQTSSNSIKRRLTLLRGLAVLVSAAVLVPWLVERLGGCRARCGPRGAAPAGRVAHGDRGLCCRGRGRLAGGGCAARAALAGAGGGRSGRRPGGRGRHAEAGQTRCRGAAGGRAGGRARARGIGGRAFRSRHGGARDIRSAGRPRSGARARRRCRSPARPGFRSAARPAVSLPCPMRVSLRPMPVSRPCPTPVWRSARPGFRASARPRCRAPARPRAGTTAEEPTARGPGWVPGPPVVRAHPDVRVLSPAPRPGTTRDTPAEVVVRRGDSLWSIAARHLGPDASDAEIARRLAGLVRGQPRRRR